MGAQGFQATVRVRGMTRFFLFPGTGFFGVDAERL
jgi:hypothetical protein